MTANLQQHIFTLISQYPGSNFLGMRVRSNFTDSVSAQFCDMALAQSITYLNFLSDMILYIGIIVVVLTLGWSYNKISAVDLTGRMLKVSTIFIYFSLLTNLLGIYLGFDFLSAYSILLFDGSYCFSLFSQVFKIVMLLLIGVFYSFFPYILNSNIRVLEVPLLIQITLALCSTLISSNNLALLLLALEGFSLLLYVMTALGRTYGGITACVKYFAFGTLGSIFLF